MKAQHQIMVQVPWGYGYETPEKDLCKNVIIHPIILSSVSTKKFKERVH